MLIGKALLALGYENGYYIVGDTYEGIHWVVQPETIPTKQEVMAMVEQIPALEEAEQTAKAEAKASAIAKLAALGLTDDEVQALVGA